MVRWLPIVTYGYTLLVVIASLGKFVVGILPNHINHSDKMGHFSAYAGFVLIWFLFFNQFKQFSWKKSSIVSLLWSVFFGILMEFCQALFTSYRQFDFYDMLANTLGSLAGLLLFGIFFVFIKKRQQ